MVVCVCSGNVLGQKPYLAGRVACSQCERGQFYCNNGLCDGNATYSFKDLTTAYHFLLIRLSQDLSSIVLRETATEIGLFFRPYLSYFSLSAYASVHLKL